MSECPVCNGEIRLAKDTVVGELIECAECGSELEVVGLNPDSLNEAPQEAEDWGE